jgi:CBS domain-containing protein
MGSRGARAEFSARVSGGVWEAFSMHTIRQILARRELVSVAPETSVLDVARRMAAHRVGAAVVADDGRLAGIFSGRDLMARVVVPMRPTDATPVGQVMTTPVVTAGLGESVAVCEKKMRDAGCRHLPILADGRAIAMLSMRDLLWDEINEQVEENEALRAYIHQVRPGLGA